MHEMIQYQQSMIESIERDFEHLERGTTADILCDKFLSAERWKQCQYKLTDVYEHLGRLVAT